MADLHLDRTTARRIAIGAQRLDAQRPTDLVALVEQLTLLQIDPTAAIAPNADLVAWSRLDGSYQPADLTRAVEQDRTLYEHNALIRPMADLPLYLADMAVWPGRERFRRWPEVNEPFRRDVLSLLAASGPLLSRDIPDTSVEPWASDERWLRSLGIARSKTTAVPVEPWDVRQAGIGATVEGVGGPQAGTGIPSR